MNFFITNREIIKKGNKETIREDGRENACDNLRFGTYDIAKKEFTLFPEPVSLHETFYEKLKNKNTNQLKGSAKFFRLLYDELVKTTDIHKGDVLFFIHGFNTDLKGVRDNFEMLHKKYVQNPNSPIKHLLIFTWPGRTPLIPYHYFDDRKDAIRSGETLARGIEKVILFFNEFFLKEKNKLCNRKIHLMAHSMGNRVLKHVLAELQRKGNGIPELFTEIISIAADIEYTIFEKNEPFNLLIDFGKRIHVYYHNHDRVLDVSKYTKNITNRLGKVGIKDNGSKLVDVMEANVSGTKDDKEFSWGDDFGNHWYYYSSSEVVNDIINVFKGGSSKFN